jgi:hypothetical protein
MTSTVLAVSAAYVVMGVLLLAVGLTSRFAWWVKAVAIVIASGFFIEVFFATKGLLGWPGAGQLPPKFQLLWVRVVEPDRLAGDKGAIYLWIEEVDDNNVPDGVPRAFRLPYSRPLADRSALARDEIMRGKPQQGTVEQLQGEEAKQKPNPDEMRVGSRTESGITTVDLEQFQLLQQAQRVEFRPMQGPILPPKGP